MKTQSWGTSEVKHQANMVYIAGYDLFPPPEDEIQRWKALRHGVNAIEFKSWKWYVTCDGSVGYRAMRSNGIESDSPSRPFPNDGTYTWDTPDKEVSAIRYAEGPCDRAWMEEKDRNYLIRLARGDIRSEEERLDASEQQDNPIFMSERERFMQQQLSVLHMRSSQSADDVIAAMKLLVALNAVEACDTLLLLVEHESKDVRIAAASALRQLHYHGPDDKLMQSKIPLLEHGDKSIRLEALKVLRQLHYSGTVDVEAIYKEKELQEYIEVLNSSQDVATRSCQVAIQELRTAKDSRAIPVIEECIDRTLDTQCKCCCTFWKIPRYMKVGIAKAREAIAYIQSETGAIVEDSKSESSAPKSAV